MNKKIERPDITAKVEQLILNSSKTETSENLGISRPTLDSKLKSHKWKVLEIKQIERLHGKSA